MFKYTKAVANDTLQEIKKFLRIFSLVTSLIYIGYLIYAIISKTGNHYANAILFLISVAFFIFSLVADCKKEKRILKARRITRRFVVLSKLLIKAYTLGIAVYAIVLSSGETSALSIVLTVLMIVIWIIQVLAELIVYYIEKKIDIFVAAFSMDKEVVDKPVRAVENFVKRVTGHEKTEYEYVGGKMRDKIEKITDEYDERVKEEKKEKRRNSWVKKTKPDKKEEKTDNE